MRRRRRWYRKAAEEGSSDAAFDLGVMYEKAQGVGQDYTEAARWYRKAADQGMHIAQLLVSDDCMPAGMVWRMHPEEAARWYRKAADPGDWLRHSTS